MTLFPDLSHFYLDTIADRQLRADEKTKEVDPLCCHILRKIPRLDVKPLVPHLPDTLDREEAHLPVPSRGRMGVSLDAVFGLQRGLCNRLILTPFLSLILRDANLPVMS